MDIQMPYLDEIEATRTIQERTLFRCRCKRIFVKAIKIKELINAIEQYMPNTLEEIQSV